MNNTRNNNNNRNNNTRKQGKLLKYGNPPINNMELQETNRSGNQLSNNNRPSTMKTNTPNGNEKTVSENGLNQLNKSVNNESDTMMNTVNNKD